MPMHDAVIEKLDEQRITVLSPSAHIVGEELMIHVSTSTGLESHRTKVISTTPTSSGGALQYRIDLSIHEDERNESDES
jgi:hypothetical protein